MFIGGLIVGVVVGVLLLSLVALLFPVHTHKLEPRSLTPMVKKYSDGHKEWVTEVLYVCPCGYAETKEYTGSWKLEDFQVTQAKGRDKELESLRKMAGIPSEESK